MESNSVCNRTSDRGEVRIVYHEYDLPINHKSYNFREKKNTCSQVMKDRKNLCLKTDKGDVNLFNVALKGCDWLI